MCNLSTFTESDEFLVELMSAEMSGDLIKQETGGNKPAQSSSSGVRGTAVAEVSTRRKSKKGGRPSFTTKGFQRHYAKHDYHDYSRMHPTQLENDNIKASRGGVHNPFPAVLHSLMEETEKHGYSDIVSWQPHGRSFLIRDPDEFVSTVLPKYFKHSKLSSFQRQLSLYGFVRLTHDGPDRGAYYHECFLRGRPFLCCKIQRTRVKGTWVRTSSSPETEPDFYTMDPVLELDEVGSNSDSRSVATARTDSLTDEESSSNGVASPSPVKSGSILHEVPVNFLDMEVKDPEHLMKIVNEPPLDAGLQPPPAFPTHVIGSLPKVPPGAGYHTTTNMKNEAISFPDGYQMKSTGFACPSLVKASGAIPPLDDDELAHFLTDVDLDTELNSDDFVRMATF